MAWLVLVAAGLFEVGWALLLPTTDGFTRPAPSAATVALLAVSMAGLAYAVRTLPVGTAYAVWVGIGALGTAMLGIVLHGDPATPARLGFLTLLVVAIVGLKATSTVH